MKLFTWLGEICSCCCLAVLFSSALILLNTIYKQLNSERKMNTVHYKFCMSRFILKNVGEFINKTCTPQIAYRVDVCPRGNLPYMRIYPTNNTNILGDIDGDFWGYSLFKNLLIVDCLYGFNLFALRNNFTSPIFMAEVASELETRISSSSSSVLLLPFIVKTVLRISSSVVSWVDSSTALLIIQTPKRGKEHAQNTLESSNHNGNYQSLSLKPRC